MLWRPHYQTKIVRDLALPVAEIITLSGSKPQDRTEAWIAGFGFAAMTNQTVWRRLFQSDFPTDDRIIRVFILPKVEAKDIQMALSLIPPSEAARTYLVADPNDFWRQTINSEGDDLGFTAIVEGGALPLVMIGPPTEDAWEEFQTEWTFRT